MISDMRLKITTELSVAFLSLILCITSLKESGVSAVVVRKANNADPSESLNHIYQFEECKDDIDKFCRKKDKHSDFNLLACLKGPQNHPNTQLSKKCQNRLWSYQLSVTENNFFDDHVMSICGKEYNETKDCSKPAIVEEMGGKLYCLLHHRPNMPTNSPCYNFLLGVSQVVFYDYATMKPFLSKCKKDIDTLKCGTSASSSGGPSQTSVLECLETRVDQVSTECKVQLLRLVELQSDDYHLDASLFFACRRTRDELCADVNAGEGRVLQCLMKHKFDSRMESECRAQLIRRQKIRTEDYLADYRMRACNKDIHRYKCNQVATGTHSSNGSVRLSAVILCLENVDKDEPGGLDPDCKAEMLQVRKELMEDYSITPNLVLFCQTEIQSHCAQESNKPGGVLHCLLRLAQMKPSRNANERGKMLSTQCETALVEFITVVDPSEDIRVDPVISEACAPVIHSGYCQESIKAHGGNVYPCLYRLAMEPHPDSNMDEVCMEKVLQLQYVLMRKFQLSDSLYRACHTEASKLCNAPQHWYESKANDMKPDTGPIVFHCLYQKMRQFATSDEEAFQKDSSFSLQCRQEVRNVLHLQAQNINMNPLLYESCIDDLSKYCLDRPHLEEYVCLQEHVKELKDGCKKQVIEFTEAEDEDPSLDVLMMRSCSGMVKKFCTDSLTGGVLDEKQVLPCLISAKHDPGMDPKCKASIEHHQITSLEDYHISHKFAANCANEVQTLCRDMQGKADVVACLSEHLLTDILQPDTSTGPSIGAACRQELRLELFQRSGSYLLDPRLQSACEEDVKKLCAHEKKSKKGVILCLQMQQDQLSPKCLKAVFKRERLMAVDNRMDAPLQRACGRDIEKHCHRMVDPRQVLDCLREVMDTMEGSIETKCAEMVKKRLQLRRRDYRLDPQLQDVCKADLKKHCHDVVENFKENDDKESLGKVVQCLKDQYRNAKDVKSQLSPRCGDYIRTIMTESNLDIRLDPLLERACREDVSEQCRAESEDVNAGVQVVECLKHAFVDRKLRKSECRNEVERLLAEAQADVHVDPLLYRACASELRSVCGSVPLGGGAQLSCLLEVREQKDAATHLSVNCARQLDVRAEMWSVGGRLLAPRGIVELAQQVHQSEAKWYLLGVLSAIVACIFIFGLCCGRVTKRVPISMKNK